MPAGASDNDSLLSATVVLPLAIMLACIVYTHSVQHQLGHIPTVGGPSWPIISYIGSIRFFLQAASLFHEGSVQFRGRIFKVAMLDRWLSAVVPSNTSGGVLIIMTVVVPSGKLLKELVSMREDHMSSMEAIIQARETIAADHTVGRDLFAQPYEIDLIKRNLAKNIPNMLPMFYAEICLACDGYIHDTGDWVALPALDLAKRIVTRASNLILVGPPLCRNEEYLSYCVTLTESLMAASLTINMFPGFMRPMVGRHLTAMPGVIKRVTAVVAPEISRRMHLMRKHGKDYPEKPCDMLSWMMDYAQDAADPELFTISNLAKRIMLLNFGAIHGTSATLTHALFWMLATPDCIQPIRAEVQAIVSSEGFSRGALSKMHKLDSFIRESARLNGVSSMIAMRYSLRDHTFSDGTYVPAGSFIAAAVEPAHRDGSIYDKPSQLDPFRFEAAAERNGLPLRRSTTAEAEYLAFGYGKHACPGRFFAVTQLKLILAHLLLHYDLRLEQEFTRPPDMPMMFSMLPNNKAKILLKRR